MLEADIKETELIRRFDDFQRNVLPQSAPQTAPHIHPKIETFEIAETPQPSAIGKQTEHPPWVQ